MGIFGGPLRTMGAPGRSCLGSAPGFGRDKTIDMVRSFWIESRDDIEKAKNMKRLNELLDERLRLMRAQDAAGALSTT